MKHGRAAALAFALACVALACVAVPARAQFALDPLEAEVSGLEGTANEREAWLMAQAGRHIKARELAEQILEKNTRSFVAHLVIGYVNHYAEADFPRALFHLERALTLYEQRYGPSPDPHKPWRWHATLLKELANVHGTLEHYSERLGFIARFNLLYEPDMVADRAWPLMKLGRYKEARQAANLGLALADRPSQRAIALNALCAIEFEAGNDGASYEACKRAVDDARQGGLELSAVDLTNFAESSRSLFKLDEAERVGLEATEAEPSWYGNPWMELAELYTREGRFSEAWSALKHIAQYRALRPPHVRDADRNETRRAIAAFLLVVSHANDALAVTERALVLPDRRSHNSRDPAQDNIVTALLDRAAKRLLAEQRLEEAATVPFYARPKLWAQAAYLRLRSWSAAAFVERLCRDDARLTGIFRIGTAASAILPPWLAGDLTEVLGAGVVQEALARARAKDEREGAAAYYDAFGAEVAWRMGDDARTSVLADRAVRALSPGELLLRARALALGADAARRSGHADLALRHYEDAFQADPGVFRRLGLAVPVRIEARGGDVAERVASMLAGSPRIDAGQSGLALRIEADATSGSACLVGRDQSAIACGRATAKATDDARTLAAAIARDFQSRAFAPRVDMTQSDINSLDGTNLVKDDALQTLFDQPAP
ncbi:MAG TPA: tetratricopeptide repeat protein [Polyangiales bacterium]